MKRRFARKGEALFALCASWPAGPTLMLNEELPRSSVGHLKLAP